MKKILLVMSLISVLLLAGCNKNQNIDNVNIPENTDNQQLEIIDNKQENGSDDFQDSIKTVSKLDATKEWVYDSDYEKKVNAESYSTEYNETYYARDIVVPYINIDSQDAVKANNEIRTVFDSAIKTFNDGIEDKLSYVDECGYESYVNDDVLSIVLTFGKGATDVVYPVYYTYNFDLATGNRLSYEEVYKKAGFDLSDVDSKVESAITNTMKDRMSNFPSDSYPDGTTFDTYNNESIENYRKSVENDTIKYFLSNDRKINVVVKLSVPAGTGEIDTLIMVY